MISLRLRVEPEGNFVTVAETSAKIGVSTKSVYRFIQRGLLPTSKACRRLLICARAVDNFVEATK